MNKREISEIKKLYRPERCSVNRIAGCYVNAEKEKLSVFKEAFLALPEETVFKYLEIFKKNMSGTIGKNMFNLGFPLKEEKEDGAQAFLMRLRDNQLKDDSVLDQFYDKVIDTYSYAGNYLILLIYDQYDIPGKTTDNFNMDDASEEVFSYIMCMICPVDLSKPGLSYHEDSQAFKERTRDWVAGVPDIGFMFPAFNERSTDIHNVLYHIKNKSTIHPEFVTEILGCEFRGTSDDHEKAFVTIVEETLAEECTFEAVKQILSDVEDLTEENEENKESSTIGKSRMLRLLEQHIDGEEEFDQVWESAESAEDILLSDISSKGTCSMKMDQVEVKSINGFGDQIEMKMVDGRKCLVIPVEGELFINGICIQN
ncbi:MAG: DUF4317 domain-containing protein [Lachnospiraceae bacterium]|nr:DUF4317 domain-containing protein [Lachnospiraceae bacterium]